MPGTPGNPGKAKTKCVSKSALIAHLENGSYCGPCQEANLPEAVGRASSAPGTGMGLQIYPNPANGQLHLRFDTETSSVRRILLTGLDGRIVREQAAGAGVLSAVVDVEGLPTGLYILRVQDGEGSRWWKVVKN